MGTIFDGMWQVIDVDKEITLKNIYNNNEMKITETEYHELKKGKISVSNIIHSRIMKKNGDEKTMVWK